MQPFDYTTLKAVCYSLQQEYIPSRLEQVYQIDPYTLTLCLRSVKKKSWLTISWHPNAARICIGNPPPRIKDTFTLSEQLRHLINGYALIAINIVTPWERVVDFQFAKRPGESPLIHLYVEIMGKYSNLILTNADNQIITLAKQITAEKSSLRLLQTSGIYQLPPPLTADIPHLEESFEKWQAKVNLIPGKIQQQLVKTYRGVSPSLARYLLQKANISPDKINQDLTIDEWKNLYLQWQNWLYRLENNLFSPSLLPEGYTVIADEKNSSLSQIHQVINQYYSRLIIQENFANLKQQLQNRIKNLLKKLYQKKEGYLAKIQESENCEIYKNQADLLMANIHLWQPGMKEIILQDFLTNKPVKIPLSPEKNIIQNAQSLYKQHQKLKRAKQAVQPLLQSTIEEINYLEQILTNINQLEYEDEQDYTSLQEIKLELINQKYLEDNQSRITLRQDEESQPRKYYTPSGKEVLVGRNNRQNDILTFRIATDYDLWFHAQFLPGSHVLLRLNPGEIPEEEDLQFVANLAAYYSQGRESEQVPVVYTHPSCVYKPKGAKPGMVVYRKEKVIWGNPLAVNLGDKHHNH